MYNHKIESETLLEFLDKIERLEEEKQGIQDAIKEVYSEAGGIGFEPKIMRQLVRLRKMDKDKFQEHETLLALYKRAAGMLVALYDTVATT